MNIRLIDVQSINEKLPVAKLNPLAFYCHNPFEEHDFPPCKAHQYEVMLRWCCKQKGRPPAEIESAIVVRGLHAVSPDAEGDTDVAKEKVGTEGNEHDPQEGFRRNGWEEETPYLVVCGHDGQVSPADTNTAQRFRRFLTKLSRSESWAWIPSSRSEVNGISARAAPRWPPADPM